jgi:hypothetical protein
MSRPQEFTTGTTSILLSLAGQGTSLVDAFHEANPRSMRVVENGHVYVSSVRQSVRPRSGGTHTTFATSRLSVHLPHEPSSESTRQQTHREW